MNNKINVCMYVRSFGYPVYHQQVLFLSSTVYLVFDNPIQLFCHAACSLILYILLYTTVKSIKHPSPAITTDLLFSPCFPLFIQSVSPSWLYSQGYSLRCHALHTTQLYYTPWGPDNHPNRPTHTHLMLL